MRIKRSRWDANMDHCRRHPSAPGRTLARLHCRQRTSIVGPRQYIELGVHHRQRGAAFSGGVLPVGEYAGTLGWKNNFPSDQEGALDSLVGRRGRPLGFAACWRVAGAARGGNFSGGASLHLSKLICGLRRRPGSTRRRRGEVQPPARGLALTLAAGTRFTRVWTSPNAPPGCPQVAHGR